MVYSEHGESLNTAERKLSALMELDKVIIWHQYVNKHMIGVKKESNASKNKK